MMKGITRKLIIILFTITFANNAQTWTSQSSGTSNTLRSVSFSDTNNGTAVGQSDIILRTTNGGTTWTTQTSGTTSMLNGVSFTDANPPSGKLKYRLKQIDFDGKFVYSKEVEVLAEEPSAYVLEQNQPNPFSGDNN